MSDSAPFKCCACRKVFLYKLKQCGGCGIARYCSPECQKRKWPKHKITCKKLLDIFAQLEQRKLIRHINGDTLDNRRDNLQLVSVSDAFYNPNWTVDAICVLSDADFRIWFQERRKNLLTQ